MPGAIAYRHLAIRLVSTACKMAFDPALDAEDPDFEPEVVSAFGEAFNNVAVHGYRGVPPEPVQIEVDWDDAGLTITMTDTGRVFDPESVAPPDLDDLPERGMGLFIMASSMDEVDYRPGPPNVLRLVKRRAGRDGLPPPPRDGGLGRGLAPQAEGGAAEPSAAGPHPEGADGDRSSGVAVISGPDHAGAGRGELAAEPGAEARRVIRPRAPRADERRETSRAT